MDNYFRGKPVETAYTIGKHTGLRISECYGLTWDCIDFEEGIIYVEKQMKTQEGLVKLMPLKTINARRKVYMSTELKDYLWDLKEKIKEYEVIYAAQRQQNEMYILNVNETKISSLELVNTLPTGKIQTEWAIEAFFALIIHNEFQSILLIIKEHFFCFINSNFLFKHQRNSVDFFYVSVNRSSFSRNTT